MSPSQANRQESPDDVSTCNEGILFKDKVSMGIYFLQNHFYSPPPLFLKVNVNILLSDSSFKV